MRIKLTRIYWTQGINLDCYDPILQKNFKVEVNDHVDFGRIIYVMILFGKEYKLSCFYKEDFRVEFAFEPILVEKLNSLGFDGNKFIALLKRNFSLFIKQTVHFLYHEAEFIIEEFNLPIE